MKLSRWIFVGITALALCANKISAQAVSGLRTERVASGLSQPLFVTAPPGDFAHLFIVQQTGQVRVLDLQTGTLEPNPFIDISGRLTNTSGEQGLLGLAFDPNYASNKKFYLDFTVPGGKFGNGTTHVSQFFFQTSGHGRNQKTKLLEKILLTFDHPQANHNGGWIGFSPRAGDDHNLYIATGDGGNANDQGTGHIEPGGNSQNNTTLLGKMLRIHITSSGAATIPSNNPFATSTMFRKEIWAFGLRNPFRDSFDRHTGTMFIGDVGQDNREEIDVQQASNPGGGENYEWRLREGFIATPTGGVGGARPTNGVDPIFDYPHSTGQTVIGGYVYRGCQIPALQGVYVFADYLGPEGGPSTGKIFTLNFDGTSASSFQDITSELFPATDGSTLSNPSSLGEDANGELYITDISSGNVFKIVPTSSSASITSVRILENGHALVSGNGIPFARYTILATANASSQFAAIGQVTANGDGSFKFEDTFAANFAGHRYRVTQP